LLAVPTIRMSYVPEAGAMVAVAWVAPEKSLSIGSTWMLTLVVPTSPRVESLDVIFTVATPFFELQLTLVPRLIFGVDTGDARAVVAAPRAKTPRTAASAAEIANLMRRLLSAEIMQASS
jgi:hypothetical protein